MLDPVRTHDLPLRPTWEYAALTLAGWVDVDGVAARPRPAALPRVRGGRSAAARPHTARLLLIGGEPFEEHIVMWWNFVGRDHEDIATAREHWTRADPVSARCPAIPAIGCPRPRCPPSDSNRAADTRDTTRPGSAHRLSQLRPSRGGLRERSHIPVRVATDAFILPGLSRRAGAAGSRGICSPLTTGP